MNNNQNRPATFKWHGRLCSLSRLAVVFLLGTASGPPPFVVAAAVSESKAGPPGSSGGIGGRRSFRQLLLGKLEVADEKRSGETLGVVGGGHGPRDERTKALIDMMEDVHDVLQGVGPEGTSKLDGGIGGGGLDGASSIGLRDELDHEEDDLHATAGGNKLTSLLNFLSSNNNNFNKKQNKKDKNEVVLAGEVVYDVAEGSASSHSRDAEDKKHSTKNNPCNTIGLVVYLIVLALSVYTVTSSSTSEKNKKTSRKSKAPPKKRVLEFSFRSLMVLGTIALVSATSLAWKVSGHKGVDVGKDKGGSIEAGIRDATHILPSDEKNVAAVGKVSEAIIPFTLNKGMKELDDMSRSLRGSVSKDADSAGTLRRLKDVTSSYLTSIKVIQGHTHDGNMEEAAAALKSVVGDTSALVDAGNKAKLSKGKEFSTMFDDGIPASLTSDNTPFDLSDVPDDQVAKFIRPEWIDQLVGQTQHFIEVLEGVDLSAHINPKKGMKASRKKSASQGGESKFNFDFQGQESGFHSSSSFHSEFNSQFYPHDFHRHSFMKDIVHHHHKALHGKHRPELRQFSSFFEKDEIIMAKHEVRQNALGNGTQCIETCDDDDWDCNCANLFTCIGELTEYDLAILIAGGFVNTLDKNFGNFTVSANDLNLYSADGGVKDKLASLKSDANKPRTLSHCKAVLGQLFTACDPSTDQSCENPNIESFQLSTEQVCAGVNTPTKLLVQAIGDEFDGFVNDSIEQKCEPLSYDICKDFVVEFDRLYEARNQSLFPGPNPMRRNFNDSLHDKDTKTIFDHVQFPIEYKYPSDPTTGVIDRTDFSIGDGHFALVNPNTGKALGLEGDDCSPAWGFDGSDFGPRIAVQVYDSFDKRQRWSLTTNGEIESVGCSGKLLTPENDTNTNVCKVGSRLILRNPERSVTQSWKIGVDGSIAIDVDCPQYLLPSLIISEIEDDDTDTMKDNKAYVSFINKASGMALSVADACGGATSLYDEAHLLEQISKIQLLNVAMEGLDYTRKSIEEKPGRLTEVGASGVPTSSPTAAPTTSSPTYSPTISPTKIPRVGLREYNETDPTQQFVLIKGANDYVWIYSPHCSGKFIVPHGDYEIGSDQLVELRELNINPFDAADRGSQTDWQWQINGNGVIALAINSFSNVLSIDKGAIDDPDRMASADLYVYDNFDQVGKNWKNTWTVISSKAVLLGKAGSEDQVWEAVNPSYINYAVLLGFPGKHVNVTDGGQCSVPEEPDCCLSSTADPQLAKAAMHYCDESMSLLMGLRTSLGTLRAIADLVKEHGMERMPGECCFDTPTTNDQYFGVEYDPLSMNCMNTGPWHLRISQEACENAGGHWFRTPCVTLKEAIDERPARFDLDSPKDGDCRDALGQLNSAYVSVSTSHDKFTYDNDNLGCIQFCKDLPGHSSQVAMMTENSANGNVDTCSCLYQDGMAPTADEVPEYATPSPPKFYLTNPTDGTTLGLSSSYDCTTNENSIEVQTNVGTSRQQFQLSYDHHIVSVACPEQVLTADCYDQSGGGLSFKNISYSMGDNSQQWYFGSDGRIKSTQCPDLQIGSFDNNPIVVESKYFAMVNPTTGMAMEIPALSLVEALSVTIESNWSASDHPDSNVTDPNSGKYFTFDDAEWVGPFESYVDGDKVFVNQWRDGEWIWSGEVIIYELFEYPEEGHCAASKSSCEKGKAMSKNTDTCPVFCDTTPPPIPAHGMRADGSTDSDFQTGDQLSPMIGTCGKDVLNYSPHVEMQTLVMGRPSQQFYLGDNGTITSLMCPDLALAISDVVTSNYTCDNDSNSTGSNEPITIRIRSLEHASEWQFNEDKSVESTLCPVKIIDINKNGLLSAVAGALPILSNYNKAAYRKWDMNHVKFRIISGPVSFVNPSSGYALSVDGDVCTNALGLVTQDDNHTSINQQFYLGSSGALHSLMCPGLVVSLGSDAYHDCTDGNLTLQPAAGEDYTKWTFDSDGSIRNVHCSEYAIDIESVNVGSKIIVSQHSQSDGQSWKKVNARLLSEANAAAAGWNQNWAVSFVDKVGFSSSLPNIPTDGLSRTCYLPSDAFSPSFEDFAQTLDIDNPKDEDQCRNAREKLGYRRDHPHDTEVVVTYHDYECDIHFTGTDHMADAAFTGPPVFTEVEFEAPEYSDDLPLTFKELPQNYLTEVPTLRENTPAHGAFTGLVYTQQILGDIQDQVDKAFGFASDMWDKLCSTSDNWFCTPVIAGFGGCVPFPAKAICNTIAIVLTAVSFILVLASDIAFIAMNHAIFWLTDTDYDNADTNDAAIATVKNLKTLDGYVHASLEVINSNINTQHTEMRNHLQDRHQAMTTDIIDFLEQSTNILGNQFSVTNEWIEQIACDTTGYNDSIDSCPLGEDGKFLDVDKWPEGTTVPLWNKMNRIETQGKELQVTMNDIQQYLLFEATGSKGDLQADVETDEFKDVKASIETGKIENSMSIQMIAREMKEVKGKIEKVEASTKAVEAKVDELSADMKQMMFKITEALEKNIKTN